MSLRKIYLTLLLVSSFGFGESQNQALKLFSAITGVPLSLTDPRLTQMASLIQAGDLMGAAKIASSDPSFYNVTLRQMTSVLSNRGENSQVPLNDFSAMIIGSVRDYAYGGSTAKNGAGDARELLTGNFTYTVPAVTPAPVPVNNQHYLAIDAAATNLFSALTRINGNATVKNPNLPATLIDEDIAGVITSRGWGAAHLVAGTNRRPVEFVVREFMCQPFANIGDNTMPINRIRRDVDRNPGGNPETFIDKCSRCHRVLDGLAGALAFLEFSQPNEALTGGNGEILYKTGAVGGRNAFDANGIALKMNQNGTMFPNGALTFDNSWVNYAVQNGNANLGWRSAPSGGGARYDIDSASGIISGKGVKAFGLMVANSAAYSNCMAKRVFSQVCLKKDFSPEGMTEADTAKLRSYDHHIDKLATDFEANGYSLRYLFDRTATLNGCL